MDSLTVIRTFDILPFMNTGRRSIIHVLFLVFLGGAPLCFAADYFHVATETTRYSPSLPGPWLGAQPIWMLPAYGLVAVLGGLLHFGLDRVVPSVRPRPGAGNWIHVLIALVGYFAIHSLSGVLPLADVILAVGALALWTFYDRTWQGLTMALFFAGAGTAGELTLIHLGFFSYFPRISQFAGVASWLPWIYFAGSIAVGSLVRRLRLETPDWSPIDHRETA